jgi:hypothetical protein
MQTFELFIEDDRYTVPTLEFVQVRDVERARQLAAERLLISVHHRSVEVRRLDSERIFYLSRSGPSQNADDEQHHGV